MSAEQRLKRRITPGMTLTVIETHVQGARRDEQLQGQSFDLISHIGSGSFAQVWKCRSRTDDSERAVKILNNGDILQAREECIKAVCVVRSAMACGWQDTPMLHGMAEANLFDEEGNLLRSLTMICMQYIDSTTLDHIIPNIKGNTFYVKVLMSALGHAVWVLHCNGIIHMDIKPANVLIDVTGKPYLTDFGISIFYVEFRKARRMPVAGSPLYMAPEMFKPPYCYDYAVDVWALGTTAYECFVGLPPITAMIGQDGQAPLKEHIFMFLPMVSRIDMIPVVEAGGDDSIVMFLEETLCVRAEERLDITEVLRHPFLWCCDSEALRSEMGQFVRDYRAGDTS